MDCLQEILKLDSEIALIKCIYCISWLHYMYLIQLITAISSYNRGMILTTDHRLLTFSEGGKKSWILH